ncbi:ATP-dependent RNA helicase DeaD [Thermoactinomyces sp. DSM 45891]|uniref:DEAD/DEAH box helicase n=1 Tax=Thermoactinomyces sp. DSM 45891 TaxID=1761907 RepID=UPI000921A1FB|nr:DEAD/DEAH box helicase [Thermoactinomyces sp. DSM 45891]SFX12671.1 ATP-dependent RNA helicase DeaD [Thermoactinomyces sp. DSM 45891]
MAKFSELGLSAELLQAVHQMGFEEATPIQSETIPVSLAGRDVLGQAQTGTGKTAAFGIPIVEKMDLDSGHVQALILTPTRELAIQVAEELNRVGQSKKVRALPIYGGQEIDRQIRSLKKHPHIIVATPGRMQDHMRRRTIRLQNLAMVVLDEADEMLQMGFVEEIEAILSECPSERQTLLFSATMPPRIRNLASKFMIDPVEIKIKAKEVTMPSIEQYYIELAPKQKFDSLCNLLDIQSPELAIIFGRTKKRVDEITEGLTKRGYSAEGIHGDLSQARRDTVIRRFKEGTIDIMVATDVAARGLDISGVTHVYNFDIPQDSESYVHRIGRTGRAGKEGMAITFASFREMDHLRMIEQQTKRKMNRLSVPTIHEVVEGQQRLAVQRLLEVAEKEEEITSYIESAEALLESNDSVTLLSAALKLLTREPDKTPVQISDDHYSMRRGGGRRGGDRRGGGDRSFGGKPRNDRNRFSYNDGSFSDGPSGDRRSSSSNRSRSEGDKGGYRGGSSKGGSGKGGFKGSSKGGGKFSGGGKRGGSDRGKVKSR